MENKTELYLYMCWSHQSKSTPVIKIKTLTGYFKTNSQRDKGPGETGTTTDNIHDDGGRGAMKMIINNTLLKRNTDKLFI